ncbi:uncharacterized protein [Watersipora subatra]|uniref:uncharacterized protein isoform X2 n=1 Tax=Watersipora subatra TaxID=2589382 RepID=UPI00355AF8A1
MICCCHFQSTSQRNLPKQLSQQCYNKLLKYAKDWVVTNKDPERTLCKEFIHSYTYDDVVDTATGNKAELPLIHQTCYVRVTSLAKLKSAQQSNIVTHENEDPEPTIKQLRSSSSIRAQTILPKLCVICGKKERWTKKAGMRIRDGLLRAETKNAGKLKQAAELRADHSLQVHFLSADTVAQVMCYLRQCYYQYPGLKSLYNSHTQDTGASSSNLETRFSPIFCREVITYRLVTMKQILSMTQLRELHNKYDDAPDIERCSAKMASHTE